jgi:hypothetical protein
MIPSLPSRSLRSRSRSLRSLVLLHSLYSLVLHSLCRLVLHSLRSLVLHSLRSLVLRSRSRSRLLLQVEGLGRAGIRSPCRRHRTSPS